MFNDKRSWYKASIRVFVGKNVIQIIQHMIYSMVTVIAWKIAELPHKLIQQYHYPDVLAGEKRRSPFCFYMKPYRCKTDYC